MLAKDLGLLLDSEASVRTAESGIPFDKNCRAASVVMSFKEERALGWS